MAAEKLAEAVEEMNVAEQRFMCQFDTIEQLYFEKEKLYLERMSEAEERHTKEKDAMRNHYGKIILTLAITLLLLVGGLVGGMIYLFANYDFGVVTYQDVSVGNDGDSTIEDGIQMHFPPYVE